MISMVTSIPLFIMITASMVVSNTNDSYFWVIAGFGGISLQQTLKAFRLQVLGWAYRPYYINSIMDYS